MAGEGRGEGRRGGGEGRGGEGVGKGGEGVGKGIKRRSYVYNHDVQQCKIHGN